MSAVMSVEVRARVHAALGDPARLVIVDMLLLGDAAPGELCDRLGMPGNLLAHHLGVLQAAGVIVRSRSEGDRRRVYVRVVGDVLAGLTRPPSWPAGRVVFVCTHNSARSRLAAALWARNAGGPAVSAGTEPAGRVHPRAVRVARRHRLALDSTAPVHVDRVVRDDDLVVAVCDTAHEHLPARRDRLHWSVPDPARIDTDAAFEAAYTDLADRIDRLTSATVPGGST